jgi:hypothetical protein
MDLRWRIRFAFIGGVAFLAGCAPAVPSATPDSPAGVTVVTASTSTPTAVLAEGTPGGTRPVAPFPLPDGAPPDQWNEIPLMPGALTGGDRAAGGYLYTIRTGEADVIVYYDREMAQRGWAAYARGSTKDERFTTMLFYMKQSRVATIWIYQAGSDPGLLCLLLTLD